MTFKLFPKLFLVFLCTTTVLVVGMALSVNWTFKQGLKDYLYHQEMEQLDKLIPAFENLYVEYGGWELLRQNRFLLKRVLRSTLGHPSPPHDPFFKPHPKHEREHQRTPPRHPPPPRFFSLLPRLNIFDAQHQLVIGHKADLPIDTLRPLQQNGEIIGWVGVEPHRMIEGRLAQAFHAQQIQNYYLIAALALLLSTLAAGLLVTQLLRPVRQITAGACALSNGDYHTRVKVHSHDELGQLAHDFNHLAHTLESNEKARQQWIADISHELRTPLAILRGEIEAMQDGVRDFTLHQLKSLHNETLSLAKLVDDLYELSLSDLGALDYRREPVDVAEILNDSLHAFHPRFAAKNIQLLNKVTQHQILLADTRRLTQLFSNLLENSLRYTDSPGHLSISLDSDEDELVICFEDSAPGVPEEVLEKLFERLYRVDQSRSRALGGAGLGLSICRNIVLAHEGKISAYASPLGGLGLRIHLPVNPVIVRKT